MARRILVTNDDGYFSPGIRALADALGDLGEVTIVAPHNEASAVGHALTLRSPLRIEDMGGALTCIEQGIEVVNDEGVPALQVDGFKVQLRMEE